MAARGGPARHSGTRLLRRQLTLLAVAVGWLLLALVLAPGTDRALARDMATAASLIPNTGSATTSTNTTPTATAPTSTTTAPTSTATTPPQATATPKPASQPTATQPPPAPPQNGGGPPPSTGGSTGPQPTRVVLAQPTLGDSASGGQSGFSPTDMTSNGILIFATLGCVVGVIGLIALVIAWITLVSDGWGPLLKVLLLGNRRGKRRFKRKPQAEAHGGIAERGGPQAYGGRGRGGGR